MTVRIITIQKGAGMNDTKAKELHLLLFSFMGTFHRKILVDIRHCIDVQPKLKKNQSKIMHILYQMDSLTPTELGGMLDIEKGGLTTIVDQLVEMGLLIRGSDPDDRRKILLSLSADGRKYMGSVMQSFSQRIMELFQDVDPEELDQYIVNLRSVTNFMQKL